MINLIDYTHINSSSMDRRQLLKSSLALAGGTLIYQFPYVKEIITEYVDHVSKEGIKPFRINFSKENIKDLYRRIDNMIWPEMPFETGWNAGTNDKVLKDLVKYWRNEYDWFKEQEKLNVLPQFKATIEGEQVHFVHYKGQGERQPFPLLILHGWPSSFVEYIGAAPLLFNGINGKPGFDLVIPSLPGFVFSDVPKKAGMNAVNIAKRLHQLMHALDYKKYGVSGADWGHRIAREQAKQFPESIKGLHLVGNYASIPQGRKFTEEEKKYFNLRTRLEKEGLAYFEIHSTKPQTLAYALQDSPVGLLSWILEKYWDWTSHDEDLWKKYNRNQVLTTAMLYWLTGKVLSSTRIYYEIRNMPAAEKNTNVITVPTGMTIFPDDPWSGAPSSLLNTKEHPNFIHVTEESRGGHFPGMEVPELWAKDIAAFFLKVKPL